MGDVGDVTRSQKLFSDGYAVLDGKSALPFAMCTLCDAGVSGEKSLPACVTSPTPAHLCMCMHIMLSPQTSSQWWSVHFMDKSS